ncbi:MAG: HD-GYP domain-containing protein [Chloroflexota bacterium]|nr:HD-GYP domain-containing protein [Chloroflexota bacterium]
MSSLSWSLRVYVMVVIFAGISALGLGANTISPVTSVDALTATVLFVLAWAAQRYPIHLGPKLKVTVEDGATFAAALVLSPPVAMLVAGGSSLLARRFDGRTPLYDRLFNASAALLAIGGAAATYQLLRADAVIADNALAVLAAAVVGYVVRTELIDCAIALQLRRPLFAAWWLDHRRDIAQLATLFALGTIAATTAQGHPWVFILFVAPTALILVSFRETIRLRSQTRNAIVKLADLIDARDEYTFGHSQRVAEHAERLAKRMGMAPTQVELVREAARLHDVGKIRTEDRILQKRGPLTPNEAEEMHRHCDEGYEFLKQLPEFWEGAELVRLHHERYDGQGYPRGLGGDALPLEASVIAVADAWDAMTSDRPYRKALGHDEACAELRRCRGTQWDPRIVDVFIDLVSERAHASVSPKAAVVSSPA